MHANFRSWSAIILLFTGLSADAPRSVAAAPGGPTALVADGDPMIKSWVPAEFPASAAASVAKGSAVIRIIVDAAGRVTNARVLKASAPEFGEAGMAAVKQWTFTPGIDDGKATAVCLDVPFGFVRGQKPRTQLLPEERYLPVRAKKSNAELEDGPLGEYPPSLIGRGLPGRVIFSCNVDADGHASNVRVLQASHTDFVLAALESSASWKFKPARQGDLTIRAELQGEVSYDDVKAPPRSQVLAANGIAVPDGSIPENIPQPNAMADPVWPFELLLAGKGGSASVQFTVTANGAVRDLSVTAASDPTVGGALAAAVNTWRFYPAMAHGKSVEVTLVAHAEFKQISAGPATDADDAMTRLIKLARANAINGGRGLDGRLTPIYQVAPVPPDGEDGKGSATIEFSIDRDGRVRLPRIVTATKDSFGWSAATAVSQWVFLPPLRGGKPTEVKVQMPLVF